MFRREPDKSPLFQLKTPNGVELLVGSCAVRLIVRIVSAVLIAGSLLFYGPAFGKELSFLLRALGM
jgi:hypothetical protein